MTITGKITAKSAVIPFNKVRYDTAFIKIAVLTSEGEKYLFTFSTSNKRKEDICSNPKSLSKFMTAAMSEVGDDVRLSFGAEDEIKSENVFCLNNLTRGLFSVKGMDYDTTR